MMSLFLSLHLLLLYVPNNVVRTLYRKIQQHAAATRRRILHVICVERICDGGDVEHATEVLGK